MSGETPQQSCSECPEDRGSRPRSGRRWLVLLLVMASVAAVGAGGGYWFRRLLEGPVSSRNFEATVVVIRGSSHHSIVEQLRAVGLLPHPFVFDYLAWQRGKAGSLRPGRYQLRSTMSVRQIYDAMVRGAPIRITAPEGWTIRLIAQRLAEEGLLTQADSFTSAACDAHFLARHGIKAPSAEGYVLPETYFFDPGVGAGEILETMVASFERHYAASANRARPAVLTSWHQVVTLASLIERETSNEAEKPLIASVYCNRLRRGMTLDCDATICYVLSKWREPLTAADLRTDSPYNTYVHKGLPPGPIACVGGSSIDASLSPAQTDFLYYCSKGDNTHYFSKTLAEHNRAVEKFLRKGLTEKPPER